MPPERRNNVWFFVFLGLMLIGGYAILTYAVAGQQGPCAKAGNGGKIAWVNSPVPKFDCITVNGI